ncbi:MAG: class I SAM-dependent methyltransferase [Luteimonas sp.]
MMTPATERKAAGVYRSIFVDLAKVAECLARHLQPGSRLLDIGGGDGELLNRLLDLRPDVQVTMVDVADSVGKFLLPVHRGKVELIPRTLLEDHVAGLEGRYDEALVSDVMHHLPQSYRAKFLRSIHSALRPNGSIFVKDIQPGHFVSWLSLYCDKYISGDPGVCLISQASLRLLASEQLPQHDAAEIGLYARDCPNYIVKLHFTEKVVS